MAGVGRQDEAGLRRDGGVRRQGWVWPGAGTGRAGQGPGRLTAFVDCGGRWGGRGGQWVKRCAPHPGCFFSRLGVDGPTGHDAWVQFRKCCRSIFYFFFPRASRRASCLPAVWSLLCGECVC